MMIQPTQHEAQSTFRIRRPPITASGYTAEVDYTVKRHLDELNGLLGKAIFPREETSPFDDITAATEIAPDAAPEAKSRRRSGGKNKAAPTISELLTLPLKPKRTSGNPWAQGSLLDVLNDLEASDDLLTLSDYINASPELSALKYGFASHLESQQFTLPFNVKAVLEGHPAIVDYLIVYAWQRLGVRDLLGLTNSLMKHPAAVKRIVQYATISAARSRISLEQLAVPDADDDDSPLIEQLNAANLPLSATSFATAADAVIDNFIFNSKYSKLIDEAEEEIGPIPVAARPQLVSYIKRSAVPITPDNAKYFVPMFLSQITNSTAVEVRVQIPEVGAKESTDDFEVDYLEDATQTTEVSRSAVKCAAQLYYSMVVGDELDVFNAVNYFTHKYLVRDSIEINDEQLRDDLQAYVFDGRFPELKKAGKEWVATGKVLNRTRPAERQMFYRQVFNYGNAPVTEDVVVNHEFRNLWKVLMLESARYLERAQLSPHPNAFVSRTNVMQAAEDLQYNLSTHCAGMAGVIAPLVYKELQFVVHRIFEHDLVRRQVIPEGGDWWRVVERLSVHMRKARPKARALNNKAKLGHAIIRALADYNPATFEDDRHFSGFISNVDAFITTQSILQEALTDSLKKQQNADEEDAPTNGSGGLRHEFPGVGSPIPAAQDTEPAGAGDEWDF